MYNLTTTFLQEIENELNRKNFLIEDFSIESKNYTDFVELNIQYIYLPQYKFKGNIYKDEERFKVEFNPGAVTFTVRKDYLKKYDFLINIREWLNNIYNEMTKTPIARKVNEHDEILKSLQEKIHSMGEEGDQFFTKEEGENLGYKLNELEELLKNEILEKDENKDIQKQNLDQLYSEINTLRKHLDILNKKIGSFRFL